MGDPISPSRKVRLVSPSDIHTSASGLLPVSRCPTDESLSIRCARDFDAVDLDTINRGPFYRTAIFPTHPFYSSSETGSLVRLCGKSTASRHVLTLVWPAGYRSVCCRTCRYTFREDEARWGKRSSTLLRREGNQICAIQGL